MEIQNHELKIFLSLLISVLASAYFFPLLYNVSVRKNFTGMYGFREHIKQNIPNIAGIGIFAVILTSSLLFMQIRDFPSSQYGIAGLLLVMMIGMDADVFNPLRRNTLFKWLLVVVLIIIFNRNHLPDIADVFFANDWAVLNYIAIYLIFILFIYSFQYIDKIEGNTSLLTMVCAVFFGGLAYETDHPGLVVLCAAVLGTMMVFHYFEVHSTRTPMLMGKGGSWLLGYMMALLSIMLFSTESTGIPGFFSNSIIAFYFGVLFFPLSERIIVAWFRAVTRKKVKYHLLFRRIRIFLPERPAAAYLYFCFHLFVIMLSLLLSLFIRNLGILAAMVLLISLLIQWLAYPVLRMIKTT